MGQGISAVLTFAVGVAISPVPIIAVNAKAELDSLKGWLALHNAAVMTVLFVVFGVDLIAKGIPPLTS